MAGDTTSLDYVQFVVPVSGAPHDYRSSGFLVVPPIHLWTLTPILRESPFAIAASGVRFQHLELRT